MSVSEMPREFGTHLGFSWCDDFSLQCVNSSPVRGRVLRAGARNMLIHLKIRRFTAVWQERCTLLFGHNFYQGGQD
jgi:hypothetical protein